MTISGKTRNAIYRGLRHDPDPDSLTFFAPPGAVAPAALAMAREFASAVAQKTPGVDFVVAFEWADSFSYRPRIDGPRIELGPCLRLMGYARDVIGNVDGFSFAVMIPRHIYEAHTERVIAADAGSPTGLVLR